MTKEVIFTVPTQVEPYRTYYAERNGNTARYLAGILGYGFLGLVDKFERGKGFVVPPKTLSLVEAKQYGIGSEEDMYGMAISDVSLVDKQVLQTDELKDFTLKGFVAKSRKELLEVTGIVIDGSGAARVKKLGVSDGRGQCVMTSVDKIDDIDLEQGEEVVIEPDIIDKKTISVGRVILGENEFSFVAHQTNDIAPEDGRDRYTGANPVRLVRGDLHNLLDLRLSSEERIAISKAVGFDKQYLRHFKPMASRLSYDVLLGKDHIGKYLSGVTDITGRLGGTCPALVLAIKDMMENNKNQSKARVNLNYETSDTRNDAKVVFLDHLTLKITAELI